MKPNILIGLCWLVAKPVINSTCHHYQMGHRLVFWVKYMSHNLFLMMEGFVSLGSSYCTVLLLVRVLLF